MQYIPGSAPDPRYASEENMTAYEEGLRAELGKISKLNVIPVDVCACNTILSRFDKKVYLVDFNQWRFPHETDEELL